MKTPSISFVMLMVFSFLMSSQGARAQVTPDTASAPGVPTDTGWPRTHEKDGQTVVVFQPQVDEWKDHLKINFRAATAVTPRGATEPVYGVISASADTNVERDTRMVYLLNLQLDIRFPGQDEATTKTLQTLVGEVLGGESVVPISLDRVLACMKPDNLKSAGVQINLDPPPMYYSDSPAVLVIFQGAPQFKPIPGTQLTFATNTNWDLLQDQTTQQYCLLNTDSWLTAPDPVKGPWTAAASLPADLSKLPADKNWDEVRKNIPGKPATSIPKVIVSEQPAELIVTEGQPKLVAIPGTTLQTVTNPQMPLFFNTADSNYYYLVAGRWFKTNNLAGGSWSAASAQLPDEFAKIPPDSEAGYVLASVPGTEQAKDAILLASIPHQATININDTKVTVAYDGAPKFAPIEGTAMTYATNTSNQVISASGQYYCCYGGVWFVSLDPMGPWVVCTSVPAVIYTIPPSSPVYNCTYVKVYSTTPTTVVVGYTSGYSGEYVAATGALMFGAGMLAGAAIAENNCNPCYYSYGCAAHYNYAYGSYYRGAAHYGPYGGAGYSASYNSATGVYSRSASAYGQYGSASVHQAYNPYTNTAASHATASNGYQSWGGSAVSHNGNYAAAGHTTYANGASAGWAQTSSGKGGTAYQSAGGATVAKTNSGNVYAGKDGNVYQKSDSGQWQQHTSSGWQNTSAQSHDWEKQMNSEAASRSRGDFESERSSSFRSGGGGGGFGGFSGGGRRR